MEKLTRKELEEKATKILDDATDEYKELIKQAFIDLLCFGKAELEINIKEEEK